MKFTTVICLLLIVVSSCSEKKEVNDVPSQQFTSELIQLKEFFAIPGLSAMITKGDRVVYENYLGYADLESETRVDSSTAFPIASITKLYSATLIMKLAEEGKLSLDDPVNAFFDSMGIPYEIKVKHLLSHTSQGQVGQQFFYSSRFGLLTRIIEEASGKSFNEAMQEAILTPADLQNTFLLKDSLQLAKSPLPVASPYILDGEITEGFVDFGYSASAGIVATPSDLMRFNVALDENQLISAQSKQSMFEGLEGELPYAYGIFKQQIEGANALWVYGQYDCYSSLLLKVPSKDLTLVLLANNNLMSDPARLIMGDVTSSLFALSFMKNFVFDLPEMPLIEQSESVYNNEFPSELYRQKVMAQALAESFMARFDPQKMQISASLLEKTFEAHPDYLSYGGINLLHTMSFLKDVAFYMDLGEFSQFDQQIEQLGEKLLHAEPNNPYLHNYMGTFYDRLGDKEKARYHFKTIVEQENFSPNWYTNEAKAWLSDNN